MKKQLLLVIASAVFMISGLQAQDVIIGFDFSDNTDVEFNATSGTEGNIGYDIRAENDGEGTTRTLSYADGASDYAAETNAWDNGADDKYWSIKFKADGFTSMKVSSKQYSDANGPKNFKLQWRLSGGDWADVTDGAIEVGEDWTTSEIEELTLPQGMENQGTTSIYLRWIMTDNVSVSDGTVDAAGISRIDDILVTGIMSSGYEFTVYNSEISLYPNPCSNYFTIESTNNVNNIEIYSVQGALVYSNNTNFTGSININTQEMSKGMYIVKLYSDDDNRLVTKRIVIE